MLKKCFPALFQRRESGACPDSLPPDRSLARPIRDRDIHVATDSVQLSQRPWKRALAWLALLGPFFFITYGLANAWAAGRADVPSIVFDWERGMPFWAWTIVPYWSIDLFYAISPFLCRDRRELDTHAKRLLTAQVIAIACFVAFPLRYSFVRPETDGVFGWLFDVLLGFDLPYNQAPSLHIALLVILWIKYAEHLHGTARIVLHLWFALIGVSVLTTYQHHFIDIPTGLLAGWLCVWMWPDDAGGVGAHLGATRTAEALQSRPGALLQAPRRRLAALYIAGAALCIALTLPGGAWLWFWWPALSLLLVAANYLWLGAAGFQKRADGRHSIAAQWLYAPYLLAARINSRAWTRLHPHPVPVRDGVWLGRVPSAAERNRFRTIVDVCAEVALPRGVDARVLPMLDLVVPEPQRLREAAHAIEAARADGDVLVCCALGYSRSAAAVTAWLLATGRAGTLDDALATLRRARPQIVLRAGHLGALRTAFPDACGTPAA